jgi:pyruvate-formate lyase-activating enzyme
MEPASGSQRRSFRDLNGRSTPPPLWKLLPQSVPYGLIIEPTNLCNFRCPFCPTGNRAALARVARPKGTMKFELYQKIISDLGELTRRCHRKVHHLQLWKDGEPLLHPQLPEMVRLARQAEVADSIELTTNGSLLKPAAISALLAAGLDVLKVSVEHVNDGVYRTLSNRKIGYEDIRQNVSTLFSEKRATGNSIHVHVKIIDTGLSDADKATFVEDFAPLSDSWNIECTHGWSRTEIQDFALGIASHTAQDGITPRKKRLVCPEPFAKLAINFNGAASVCCADWSHGTVVGDASRETVGEIWSGEKLAALRISHLSGQRGAIPACATCDFIEGFPAFADLDEHRVELLEIFRGSTAGR